MSGTAVVKSISVGNIFTNKSEVKKNIGKPLLRVRGVIYEMFSNNTKYGEQVGFKGDIVAVNLQTGEVMESDACFLPKGLTESICKRLEDKPNEEVEFTADIKAMESSKNEHGYAWVADRPKTEGQLARREALKLEALKEAGAALPKPVPKAAAKK